MKKIKRFTYAGAVLLLSAGFAACSSDDALETSTIERGVVKTQFNIAIPGKAKTRMSEAVTQAQTTPVFRGMEKIHLIPFAKNGKILSTDNRLGDEIVLNVNGAVPAITNANTISALNPNNNSQLYKDVEVPIGTRSFLFYGVAPEEGNTADVYGQLNLTGLNNSTQTPASIKFDLQNIIAADATTDAKATAIVTYLNLIAKGNDWDAETNPLHEMYTNFISLKAGSSADVQALVQDLYTSLQTKSDATSEKLKTAILNATYVVGTTAEEDGETVFTPTLDEDDNLQFTEAISGYPANISLPDGAALVNWKDATDGFVVATELKYLDDATTPNILFNVPTLQDYVYPASLYYRANSLINTAKTSMAGYYVNTEVIEGQSPESSWNGVLSHYEDKPGTVSGETKSVAIVDQIEYAVGRMDLKIQASASSLQDNDKKSFPINNLQVTGVLIGGQKQVDYEFLPVSGATEKTIYDNKTEGIAMPTTETLANRTLVLETADNAEVKFAIEFVNNGNDFRGFDGIVPKGCKFYLIGSIKPGKTDGTPLVGQRAKDKDGNDIVRVFLQDYITTITANIGSLKNAYNVIPDLRAPKLELGLSVNLDWNAANTYSVTME